MGIFCMIFGAIVFLGFSGGGYILANQVNNWLVNTEVMGQSWYQFLGLSSSIPIWPIVVICAFIGLLIGLSFFMQGLTYQRVCSIPRKTRQ